jgi:hypothetical protein|tara:strand:+ start:948 stop:1130 length:183 start_codon:yes stop_codon:yes gene_type:complete
MDIYKNEFTVTPHEDVEYSCLWLTDDKDLFSVVDNGAAYGNAILDPVKKYKVTVLIEEVE